MKEKTRFSSSLSKELFSLNVQNLSCTDRINPEESTMLGKYTNIPIIMTHFKIYRNLFFYIDGKPLALRGKNRHMNRVGPVAPVACLGSGSYVVVAVLARALLCLLHSLLIRAILFLYPHP